jgi:hypothetical protein
MSRLNPLLADLTPPLLQLEREELVRLPHHQ